MSEVGKGDVEDRNILEEKNKHYEAAEANTGHPTRVTASASAT